jgi:hypothetical protein
MLQQLHGIQLFNITLAVVCTSRELVMKNILQLRVVDLLLIGVCLLISSLMLIIR